LYVEIVVVDGEVGSSDVLLVGEGSPNVKDIGLNLVTIIEVGSLRAEVLL
jgi:hypothetical protein